MRVASTFCLVGVLVAGCGVEVDETADDPTSDAELVEDASGKADGVTYPLGAYARTAVSAGEHSLVVLFSDNRFHRETLVACFAAPCYPVAEDGTYKFYKSGSTRYVRFKDETGATIDTFAWKLNGGLQLRKVNTKTWFTFSAPATGWCGDVSDCSVQGLPDPTGGWSCDDTACVDTATIEPTGQLVSQWYGVFNESQTRLGYDVAANYDANYCEFYVESFAKGEWSHNGSSGKWIQGEIAYATQDGTLENTGVLAHVRDSQGHVQDYWTIGHATSPGHNQVGFTYEKSGPAGVGPGTLLDFAFFIDVRRPGGEVVRLWQSNWGSNYSLAGVFAAGVDHTESLGSGTLTYAASGSSVYDPRWICE